MSAATTSPKPEAIPPKPLKPEALDTLAAEYLAIEQEITEARTALAEKLKPKIERMAALNIDFVAQCHTYGSPHEKKSKLLSGLNYEVMTTESSTSSPDQTAITTFRRKCEGAEKLNLFEELFEKVSEYRMRPGADAVVRRSIGERMTGALAKLFLKCVITKINPPRLTGVRLRTGGAAVSLTKLKALAPIESAAEIRRDRQYVFRMNGRLPIESAAEIRRDRQYVFRMNGRLPTAQMEALAAQLRSLGLKKPIVIDRDVEIFELEAVDNSPESRAVSSEQNR